MGNTTVRVNGFEDQKIEDRKVDDEELQELDNEPPETFYRGVSLEFLKEVLRRGQEYGRARGNRLKELITLPETKLTKISLAEVYESVKGPSGKPYIGDVKFFVSHAWQYKFSELVQGIERFENGNDSRKGAYYFVDYFAVNQWNAMADLKSLKWLIQNSDAVVLVLSPLKKPYPMTRCWCLYEIHAALEYDTPIYGTVPDDQCTLLRAHLVVDDDMTFEVDTKNAKATVKEDELKIKADIEKTIGFDVLDRRVYTRVVACVRDLAISQVGDCGELMQENMQLAVMKLFRDTSMAVKNLSKPDKVVDIFAHQEEAIEEKKSEDKGVKGDIEKKVVEKQPEPEEEKTVLEKEPEVEEELPKSLKCNHDWQFCSETWTHPDSLSRVFVCIFDVIVGELEDISELVLKYIGGCDCFDKKLSDGIFSGFVHSGLCDHCSKNCNCEESIFLCNVCYQRNIKYCTRCKFRHVGSHQCK